MEIKKITSRNNEYIKSLSKLSDKKYRTETGLFAFEGRKLLSEAISSKINIQSVLFTDRAYNLYDCIKKLTETDQNFELINVTDEVYNKISFEKSPEGIFTVAKPLDKSNNLYIIYRCNDFSKKSVILDGIRDPGNLGTVLRTASAFGINRIIISDDCADIYNNKTIRASMGAVFRTEVIRVSNLPETIKSMRECGFKIYAAALDHSSILLTDLEIDEKTAFIIGNEGSGIRPEVISSSDRTVIIPMENGTESLNAASAATIILWEMYRRNK